MAPADSPQARSRALLPLAISFTALLLFYAVGVRYVAGLRLDLGSIGFPANGYLIFLAFWAVFGSLAAAALAVALSRVAAQPGQIDDFVRGWTSGPDSRWILAGSILGLALPLGLRAFVLQGTSITDDESSYRFMAQLLAEGRLWADSPPLKLFFDRVQMVNDGRLYSQYFLGWPALMVPGVWLGGTGGMNALYSALTVPALFLVLRRLTESDGAGSGWARLGLVLFLSAPMIQVAAATELAHTSTLAALAWLTWAVLRSRDEAPPPWIDAVVALLFSTAFFIRPTAALGIGAPLLVAWFAALCRRRSGRLRGLITFALPAALMAGLFLGVNLLQNGSPTQVAYQATLEYARANGFRFSAWPDEPGIQVANLRFGGPVGALAQSAVASFRLNFALFGWPCSLLFALLAGRRSGARLLWAMLICFLVVHLPLADPGIDSFGPVHYFETSLPILLLSVLGVRRLSLALARLEGSGPEAPTLRALPAALMASLVLVSLLGYLPARLTALGRIADNIALPERTAAAAGLGKAVVFAPRPFAPNCLSRPTRHFVFFRPNNRPDLSDEVLWVNHLSIEENRRLMEHFPDREGYVMVWTQDCRVALPPLDDLQPGAVPRGRMGGTEKGLDG